VSLLSKVPVPPRPGGGGAYRSEQPCPSRPQDEPAAASLGASTNCHMLLLLLLLLVVVVVVTKVVQQLLPPPGCPRQSCQVQLPYRRLGSVGRAGSACSAWRLPPLNCSLRQLLASCCTAGVTERWTFAGHCSTTAQGCRAPVITQIRQHLRQ
jgi:hypothetical protein